jgi:hypothetical protein
VFDANGEIVSTLPDALSYGLGSGLTLSAATLVPGTGSCVTLFLDAAPAGSWCGTNAAGQLVSPGIYTLQALVTDTFGHVTTFTQTVQALQNPANGALLVANSAGERVRTLLEGFPAGGTLSLSGDSLVLGAGSSGATVKASVGAYSAVWDGRNDFGKAVAPGIYWIESAPNSNSRGVLETKSVLVLAAGSDPFQGAWVAPNPAPGRSTGLEVGLPLPESLTGFRGRVLNLAGKTVAALRSVGGGRLRWDFSGPSAPGIYWIVVEGEDVSGTFHRKVFKAAVVGD